MKGLSYNKNKPTWKEKSFLCLWPLFFLLLHDKLPLQEKSQRKKYKAFFTFPGSKYLTVNTVYITLHPPTRLFFWSMLSGMTNNPKVKKCLIIGTHLPHGTAQLRGEDGGGRGQAKKTKHPTTEEPYGIDIRQRAHALKPFLLERKKNWHKFFRKEITPIQSNPAL